MKKHPTSNIQHRTPTCGEFANSGSNIERCRSDRRGHWVNNIGNSMLTNFGFTPCKAPTWLLEPMKDAAEFAAQDAVILLSPARSSIDGFQKARKCSEKLYIRAESISWGEHGASPNINGEMTGNSNQKMSSSGKYYFSLRGFLREKHEANHPTNSTSSQKGRQPRQSK